MKSGQRCIYTGEISGNQYVVEILKKQNSYYVFRVLQTLKVSSRTQDIQYNKKVGDTFTETSLFKLVPNQDKPEEINELQTPSNSN